MGAGAEVQVSAAAPPESEAPAAKMLTGMYYYVTVLDLLARLPG